MAIVIFVYNNNVGILTDALLLKDLLYKYISKDIDIIYINNPNIELNKKYDIAIWIQNPLYHLLNKFDKNIFYINEEWCKEEDLIQLHKFNYVICKNKFIVPYLEKYSDNIVYLPFISKNIYKPHVKRINEFIHFNGKSIQKNYELIRKYNNILSINSNNIDYKFNKNDNIIKDYLPEQKLYWLLNHYNIHVCTSLYESWGHYLFEALSTGNEIICSDIPVFREMLPNDLVHFIPVKEYWDLSYKYDFYAMFPLRFSYHVDEERLKDVIYNFKPIGRNYERIKYFNQLMNKNKRLIIEWFNKLIHNQI